MRCYRQPYTDNSIATHLPEIGSEKRVVAPYCNDQAGNCSYGAAILAQSLRCTQSELGVQHIAREQIENTLEDRTKDAEEGVKNNVTPPLTQAQFDALVRITYHTGPGSKALPRLRRVALGFEALRCSGVSLVLLCALALYSCVLRSLLVAEMPQPCLPGAGWRLHPLFMPHPLWGAILSECCSQPRRSGTMAGS